MLHKNRFHYQHLSVCIAPMLMLFMADQLVEKVVCLNNRWLYGTYGGSSNDVATDTFVVTLIKRNALSPQVLSAKPLALEANDLTTLPCVPHINVCHILMCATIQCLLHSNMCHILMCAT